MGLFSRSPKIPEPHVTRTIKTPQDIYHPGSQLLGIFTLQSPTQRRIIRAEATFHGTCISHANRSESSGTGDDRTTKTIHYHDEAPLFQHTQLLQSNFFVQPGQTFSWQFDFTFPSESVNTRGEVYRKDTALSPLYQVLPHALPPTFAVEISHSTYARVEYNVEAVIHFEDTNEPHIVKFEQLHFAPYLSAYPVRAPFAAHVQDLPNYASSRLTGEAKSFRRSIRDKLSSSTPSLDIRIKSSVMPVVTGGAKFPLYLCVELTNLSDPYAIVVPEVGLRIKSLKLLKLTTHRAMRVDGWASYPETEDKHKDDVPLNALPETMSVVPQIGDQKQLMCQATFEARIPGDTCPTFATLNMNYSCILKAVIEVEVCGKTFEHKFNADGFQILPS